MKIAPQRFYIDTSVVGGCCDAEFALDSIALLNRVRTGDVIALVTGVLFQELE